jgi:hypothetical protein
MTAARSRLFPVVRSLTGLDLSSLHAWWTSAASRECDPAGPRTNRRLTALTGTAILPLAALALLTGLFFGDLWRVHYFIGYMLLPVVLLKLGSTGYRMVRYYLRSGLYRFVQPPYPVGRLSSPLLVLSVVLLYVSVIVMWVTHSQANPWGWLHTDAAIAFSVLVALHLGLYLPEAFHAVRGDLRPTPANEAMSRSWRLTVVSAAVLAGLVVALATVGVSRIAVHAHRGREGKERAARAITMPRYQGVNSSPTLHGDGE